MLRLLIASSIAALLGGRVSGCATVLKTTTGVDLAEPVAPLELPPDLVQRFGAPTGSTPAAAFLAFETNHPPGQPLNTREIRRELAHSLLRQSDALCEKYLTTLSAGRNGVTAGLDVGGLMFGALGAASTTVADATRWAAASTLAQSTRTSLGQTVFAGKEFALLYGANRRGRFNARTELLAQIERGDFDRWSLSSVFSVVNAYHQDCGINYGLQQLATGS